MVPTATFLQVRRFMVSQRSTMEFEGRAARRPMPRQMDMSDWNMDIDMRNSGSSLRGAYQRDERRIAPDMSRRLSSGEELRYDASSLLRPVNRYDTSNASTIDRDEIWRVSETAVRAPALRQTQLPDRDASPQRLPPRSIPVTRRISESVLTSQSHRDVPETDARARLSAWGRTSEAANDDAVARSRWERTYDAPSTPLRTTPPREQTRQASPASTVQSDASTMLTSSPFTASITDTPQSTRSTPTPPFTPSSDDASSRLDSPKSTPPPLVHRRALETRDVPRAVSTTPTIEDEALERPPPPQPIDESPNRGSSVTPPVVTTITPREQREQLYAFRRDVRQVFARVDEMVDLHRDMFKCDVLSGLPAFDDTMARETAEFTNATFDQLTKLRQRFQEMTIAWAQMPTDQPTRPANRVRDGAPSLVDMSSISSLANDRISEDESVVSSESSVELSSDVSRRPYPVPRWQPSLLAPSNHDDDEEESSSVSSGSDACSSSLLSDFPTISRPSTASSSDSKPNVFEDFDRRMEEIRASLNAVARCAPSPRPVSTQLSTTSAFKSRSISSDDASDDTRENNARVANRVPWQAPRDSQQPTTTTRHDREARLRQLLRELQTTGERLDVAS